MEFKEQIYPVDKEIFNRIIAKRGMKAAEMSRAMGYSDGTISQALSVARISRRLAAALFNTYGITPNDYAPKIPGVNAQMKEPEIGVMRFDEKGREVRLDGTAKPEKKSPLLDMALLRDGVYTLEFVDVRKARKSESGEAEGYRFVTVATNENGRAPFYFGLFDKKPGGMKPDQFGAAWIRHMLRVTMGEDYRDDATPRDVIGRKCRAYIQIYDNGSKRYNRCAWVEPLAEGEAAEAEPLTWQDFLNADTETETLIDALQYIAGELGLRIREPA